PGPGRPRRATGSPAILPPRSGSRHEASCCILHNRAVSPRPRYRFPSTFTLADGRGPRRGGRGAADDFLPLGLAGLGNSRGMPTARRAPALGGATLARSARIAKVPMYTSLATKDRIHDRPRHLGQPARRPLRQQGNGGTLVATAAHFDVAAVVDRPGR